MNAEMLTTEQTAAWDRYQRMRTQLAARINREIARETGLSEADYGILTALAERGDDAMRALALRCGLEWEKSRLSHQLRRMEQRGLLIREHCEEDNRGAVVRVTDAGREAAGRARVAHDRAVQTYVLDAIGEEQLVALGDIAGTILDQFDRNHR